MDRDVSHDQMKNYIADCGLRANDNLTLAEFARCYYYLFFDNERDGNIGGSYHSKVFGKNSSTAKQMDDAEPLTISECAQRTFAQGWSGTSKSEVNLFMRRLSIGRSEPEIIALNVAAMTFEEMDDDLDGEIQTADIIPFRKLKSMAQVNLAKAMRQSGRPTKVVQQKK